MSGAMRDDIKMHEKLAALLEFIGMSNERYTRIHLINSGKSLSGTYKCENISRERHRSTYHLHDGRLQRDVFADGEKLTSRPTTTELRIQRLAFPRKAIGDFRPDHPRKFDETLHDMFLSYCFQNNRRGQYMDPAGFLRLIRDAQILDNKLTQHDMHDFFDNLERVGMSSEGGDSRVDYKEFKHLVTALAVKLFPPCEGEGSHESLVRLLREHLLPFHGEYHPGGTMDMLLGSQVNEVLLKYRRSLQRIFAHYATLDMASFTYSNWKTILRHQRPLSLDEYLKFLLNFEVVPYLVSRNEAISVFKASNQDVDFPTMLPTDLMSYSQFVESFGRLAHLVFSRVESKVSDPGTPLSELTAVRRLVGYLEGAGARGRLLAAIAARASPRVGGGSTGALTARSRDLLARTIIRGAHEDNRHRVGTESELRMQIRMDRIALGRMRARELAVHGLAGTLPESIASLSGLTGTEIREETMKGRGHPNPGIEVTVGGMRKYIDNDVATATEIKSLEPILPAEPSYGEPGVVPQLRVPGTWSGGESGSGSPSKQASGGSPSKQASGSSPGSRGSRASPSRSPGGSATARVARQLQGFEDHSLGRQWSPPIGAEMKGWGVGGWNPANNKRTEALPQIAAA